jgi:hypothetical protein
MKISDSHHSLCAQNRLHCLVSLALLCMYLLAQLLQLRVGLADNGDYYRLQFWFSSAPVGFSANYPSPAGSDEFNRRFFHYWVQLWKLDFPKTNDRVLSSTLLLILPGVWLNQIFYSRDQLYLLFVSLFPRFCGFVFLCLVFYWVGRRARRPVLHDILLGLPLAWFLSTTDIIAYYGSFFQETGSLIYLLVLLVVMVFLSRRPASWGGFGLYLAGMLLLATSKSSQVYWPFLGAPFAYLATPPSSRRTARGLAVVLGTVLLAIAAARLPAVPLIKPYNQYNALFTGVLTLSRDPQGQLDNLRLGEYGACTGVDAYSPAGNTCLNELNGKITYFQTLEVLTREPGILIRQFDLIQQVLYQFSSDSMGKFAYGVQAPAWYPFLNLPSQAMARFGPRGLALPVVSILAVLAFIAARQHSAFGADLAICGLILLAAGWVDMYVQILGDGQRDLLKHLFLSNICLGLAFIAAFNALILAAGPLVDAVRKGIRQSFHRQRLFSSPSTPK